MNLETVDLEEAAVILKAHKETVRLKAKRGEIPGRKVGKRWIFSQVALIRYLAGEWIPRVVEGGMKEESPCHSLNAVQARTGITGFTRLEAGDQYKAALAPQTKSRRKNSMTA